VGKAKRAHVFLQHCRDIYVGTALAHLCPPYDSAIAPYELNANQSLARSTYEPSAVITTIRVPVATKGGTIVRTPFDNVAGL